MPRPERCADDWYWNERFAWEEYQQSWSGVNRSWEQTGEHEIFLKLVRLYKTLQGLRSVVSARWRKDCYEVRLNISKYFQNFLRDRNKIFTATTPGLEQHQLTPVKNIFLMQLFLTVYWNNALHRFCISYEMKTTMFGIWSKGMVLYFHFFLFVSENI